MQTKINYSTALKIIQLNPELSDEEKTYLLEHGRVYGRPVKEILENTPLDEFERKLIPKCFRTSSRGPNPPIFVNKEKEIDC